jgi:hypothetical protein
VGVKYTDLSRFDRAIAAVQGNQAAYFETKETTTKLLMPGNFRILRNETYASNYIKYMYSRGYKRKDISLLHKRYNLRYANSGFFKYRVILPVYIDHKLVTWTGRTIDKGSDLRYSTLTTKPEKAKQLGTSLAKLPISDCLGFFDHLMKHPKKTLFITEGPFDALWLDYHFQTLDCRATCLFGLTMSENKKWLFDRLADKFEEFVFLLDQNELSKSMRMAQELSVYDPKVITLPDGVEDPAVLTIKQIKELGKKDLSY